MYLVKNKMKDVRKFRSTKLGRDVFVNPGETIKVLSPPEKNESVWEVKKEEKEIPKRENITKPIKTKTEVETNDSSSS